MRRALLPATLGAVLVACGGGAERDAAPAAGTAHGAAAMIRADHAPELVFMTRVAGDDPLPFSISLRADGNAAVRFGGGHGGWHDKAIELSDAQQARARRLIAAAPWRRLAGNTVEPGGFGGDDNGNRYMLRRAGRSVTVAEGHMPRSSRVSCACSTRSSTGTSATRSPGRCTTGSRRRPPAARRLIPRVRTRG